MMAARTTAPARFKRGSIHACSLALATMASPNVGEVGERIYFGELTFAPNAGFMRFIPPEMDMVLGAKWPGPANQPICA